MPDLDLVAFFQPLTLEDAAPIEPGAIGRAEILDIPKTVSEQEVGVLARGTLIVENQRALPADGEVVVEDAGLISGLDDERLGRRSLGEGGIAGAGDCGYGGFPSLLLLPGGVFPRRKRPRVGVAVSFVRGSC